MSLFQDVHVVQSPEETRVYLEELLLARYMRVPLNPTGELIDLAQEYGFEGYIDLSKEFFTRFRIPRPMEQTTDMQNIAKAFFRKNRAKHVCLVQYLHPHGSSARHYHTMPEVIAQIAGESSISLQATGSAEITQITMTPGVAHDIAPYTFHIVRTKELGSLTLPVKPLVRGRRDHFYEVGSLVQ